MKSALTSLLLLALCVAVPTATHAQFAFGMKEFVAADNAYGKISIPAAAWAEAVKASKDGIPAKDACLLPSPAGTLEGWQADYDNDGKEEIWALYHNGGEPGCNVVAVLRPAGGTKYELEDLLSLPGGTAMMRPIATLDNGVQMYLQMTYALPDGTPETKGSILAFRESSILILISWTQKNSVVEGKKRTEDVQAAFSDMNFDNRKELLLRFSTYDGPSTNEKNLVDRYVLTLDYLPQHMRYGVYDSSGFDKVKNAEKLAQTGQRLLGREETRDDGIVKIREALNADPFLNKTRVKLGQFFLNAGKYGDAERMLLVARDMDPSYPKTWKLLGDTYLRLNDLQKALAVYQRYLEIAPKGTYLDRRQVEHNVKQITIPKARIKY